MGREVVGQFIRLRENPLGRCNRAEEKRMRAEHQLTNAMQNWFSRTLLLQLSKCVDSCDF